MDLFDLHRTVYKDDATKYDDGKSPIPAPKGKEGAFNMHYADVYDDPNDPYWTEARKLAKPQKPTKAPTKDDLQSRIKRIMRGS